RVGLGENADLFTAIHAAILKMEKQAIKVRAKWRDSKRGPKRTEAEASGASNEGASEPTEERKIFRINHHQRRKPMTLDEALLEMEKGRDYLVYRDAETDRVAVVVAIREGQGLKRFPAIYARIRREIPTRLIFMEADDDTIIRRFSETRRPHPLGTQQSIGRSIRQEREMLAPIRNLAELTINT